jgi:hypothetical protein
MMQQQPKAYEQPTAAKLTVSQYYYGSKHHSTLLTSVILEVAPNNRIWEVHRFFDRVFALQL